MYSACSSEIKCTACLKGPLNGLVPLNGFNGSTFISHCGNESHYPLMTHFPCEGVAVGYDQSQNDLLSKCFFKVDSSGSLEMLSYRPRSIQFVTSSLMENVQQACFGKRLEK